MKRSRTSSSREKVPSPTRASAIAFELLELTDVDFELGRIADTTFLAISEAAAQRKTIATISLELMAVNLDVVLQARAAVRQLRDLLEQRGAEVPVVPEGAAP